MKKKEYLEILVFYIPDRIPEIIKRHPSMESAIFLQCPTQKELQKAFGDKATGSFLKMWLSHLRKVVKVKNTIEDYDIRLIISSIQHEYSYLKISEMSVLFIHIAQGKFEPFYHKLDADYILRCFNQHRMRRNYYSSKGNEDSLPTITRLVYILRGLKKYTNYRV